jgi:hypothetical protein
LHDKNMHGVGAVGCIVTWGSGFEDSGGMLLQLPAIHQI